MRFYSLGSGSSGNSTLIENNGRYILIDVGLTYKDIVEKLSSLSVEVSMIEAVIITHSHTDHMRSIKFFKDEIRYGIGGQISYSLPSKNYLNPYESYKICDLDIFVLPASHDVDTLNFVIKSNDETLVYITDTGYISNKNLSHLVNADYYFFESNHDVKMLMNSNRPIFLKKRILSDKGHLSNEVAGEYLVKLIGDKTKEIMFCHLSEVANTCEVCLNSFKNISLKRNIDVSSLKIHCAERFVISQGGNHD